MSLPTPSFLFSLNVHTYTLEYRASCECVVPSVSSWPPHWPLPPCCPAPVSLLCLPAPPTYDYPTHLRFPSEEVCVWGGRKGRRRGRKRSEWEGERSVIFVFKYTYMQVNGKTYMWLTHVFYTHNLHMPFLSHSYPSSSPHFQPMSLSSLSFPHISPYPDEAVQDSLQQLSLPSNSRPHTRLNERVDGLFRDGQCHKHVY